MNRKTVHVGTIKKANKITLANFVQLIKKNNEQENIN